MSPPPIIVPQKRSCILILFLIVMQVFSVPDYLQEQVEQSFLNKDYVNVISLTEYYVQNNTLPQEPLFLRGVAQLRLGLEKEGRETLSTYLQKEGRFSTEAQNLLDQFEDSLFDYFANVQFGVGYDSRVPYFEQNGQAGVFEGEDQVLRMRFTTHLYSPKGWELTYQNNLQHLQKYSQESRWTHHVEAGANNPLAGGLIRWRGVGQFHLLDYEEERHRYGGKIEWAHLLDDSHYGRIGLELGQENWAADAAFDARYHRIFGELQFTLAPFYFIPDVAYNDNNANDNINSFVEWSAGMLTLYPISETLLFGGSTRYSNLMFDTQNPVYEKKREDQLLYFRVWLSYQLHDRIAIAPSLQWLDNRSNVEEGSYDEYLIAIDTIFKL